MTTKVCVTGTKGLPVEGSDMTSQEEGQDTRNLNYVQEKLQQKELNKAKNL
jgi:hypothetical protein